MRGVSGAVSDMQIFVEFQWCFPSFLDCQAAAAATAEETDPDSPASPKKEQRKGTLRWKADNVDRRGLEHVALAMNTGRGVLLKERSVPPRDLHGASQSRA